MVDRIGQRIENYRLMKLLGRGQFGEVYLGEQIYDKSLVAIKTLAHFSPENAKGFINEASTNFKLRHPHIVQLLSFGIDNDDTAFLVMTYAPHGSLRTRLPQGHTLSLPEVVGYAQQIADALDYAHSLKVIHCDIKPENILLRAPHEVLLTDFGISTVAHRTASFQDVSTIAGTALYMAPEQFRGKPRPASDQYALGIMVYEWLCGKPPFEGGNFIQLGYQHTHTSPPPLRPRVPILSLAGEQAIMRALAKEEHERFATVRDFIQALAQASGIALAPAPQAGPSQFSAPPVQPQTPPAATVAAPPPVTNVAYTTEDVGAANFKQTAPIVPPPPPDPYSEAYHLPVSPRPATPPLPQQGYHLNPYESPYQGGHQFYGQGQQFVAPTEKIMGLSPNAAAGLSYLFGWISSVIFLNTGKTNRLVRFHAMQSLLLNSINIVIFFAIGILANSTSSSASNGSSVTSCLAFVYVVLIVLWIIAMISGFRGKYFKLWVIGNMAESHANKAK